MSSLRGFNGEKRQTDILNQLIKIDSKTGTLPTGGASEAKQDIIIANQTNGTQESKAMGSEDGTTSGTQKQVRVDGNGRLSVDINSGVAIATIGSGGHLPSGAGVIALGLETTGTARALDVDSNGRQIVNVLGNTEADGSGTPEYLHTDGNGNLNTQVINTLSVNGYRSNISSGATNQHALVNVAGYQYNKIYGNNSGSDVQLKCDANGVLETSGGGGGSSSLSFLTATIITAGTTVPAFGTAEGTIDLGATVPETGTPKEIYITTTMTVAVSASIEVELSVDNTTYFQDFSFSPASVSSLSNLTRISEIVNPSGNATFSFPRYLKFRFTNQDGFGTSTDAGLKINYYG
tara:strand:- start:1955 stop:3001 length:1047 start_codon:yes stop_codon:yes gene_type:complete